MDPDEHCATYTVGLFVAALRGRGLGREVTRLVLAWAFDVVGVHRVQLEVLASNSRAINCYLACGFRPEGVRREAELYPDGWKDIIMMSISRSAHTIQAKIVRRRILLRQPTGALAQGYDRRRRGPALRSAPLCLDASDVGGESAGDHSGGA